MKIIGIQSIIFYLFSGSLAIYPSTDNANFSVKHHDQQYKGCRSFTPLTVGSKGTENFNWDK